MAVFTKLLKEDIEIFISEYSVGNLDSFEELKYFFVSQRLIETEQLPDNDLPCPSKVNWMWFLIPLAFLFWRK